MPSQRTRIPPPHPTPTYDYKQFILLTTCSQDAATKADVSCITVGTQWLLSGLLNDVVSMSGCKQADELEAIWKEAVLT
jgi:hypothetical protein